MTTLTILKIDSSPRADESFSRKLTTQLVDRIVANNVGANVTTRDLSAAPSAVSEDFINAAFTPADARTPTQNALLAFSNELLAELKAADAIVIGLPIYNFGMPAALKAWVDLICRVGETFQYDENGPQGLLSGKRAYIAVSSGGVPINSSVDFATPHMKQIMNFIGISDVTILGATGLAADPVAPMKDAANAINGLDVAW